MSAGSEVAKEYWEINMYGLTETQLDSSLQVAESLGYTRDLYIAAILSDCQEALKLGNIDDSVRQWLNRAKYYLSPTFTGDKNA